MACFACANQQMPTGGPKDEIPPTIDTENSTPNEQVNFTPEEIEIHFDEFVKLDDAFNQVVISPPTEKRPEITVKGKSVRVKFDKEEVLRENATYTINFGDAIKDITAGNVVENYTYVFSTGPFLDSLTTSGKVVDALEGKAVENITIMLYDNLADSVVYTEKPFYFAKTNKEGTFKINNIKEGTYKAVAFEDINRNFKFEPGNEKIGFLNDPIAINSDTSINLNFRVSLSQTPLRLIQKSAIKKGLIVLGFNQRPLDISLDLGGLEPILQTTKNDSIYLWYDVLPDTSFDIITKLDTLWADTFNINANRIQEQYTSLKIVQAQNLNKGELCNGKSIILHTNRPIQSLNKNLVSIRDSSAAIEYEYNIQNDSILISSKWQENMPYTLTIDSNAIQDIFNESNDSLGFNFITGSVKDFANLAITLDGLSSNQYYIISMEKGNSIIFKESIEGDSTFNKNITLIKPDTYTFTIIQDDNKNGQWDGPNYDKGKQAEKISKSTVDGLRANWDKDLIINWSEK
ncbi:MAG: Ig-like domain-containing protein [Bacteroidota bacterium]